MDLEHEKRLTEVEARSRSIAHRLVEVEKKQDDLSELVGTVKVLATKEAQVEADVKEIKDDVKNLTNKPGKRWELIVVEGIKLLVVAVLGYLLAKFGL